MKTVEVEQNGKWNKVLVMESYDDVKTYQAYDAKKLSKEAYDYYVQPLTPPNSEK